MDVNSAAPLPPFTNWATAATSIQDAVDAAAIGDEVLVTNGVYNTGGRVGYGALTNRALVDKAVILRSVNGPAVTTIQGGWVPTYRMGDSAIRCVSLASNAVLAGFTLTNGATRAWYHAAPDQSGGGVWCESASAMVSNCVITGNQGAEGGGASGGTLRDCTVSQNSADNGGGAESCTLSNCTLMANYAYESGGGADGCTLQNCTLFWNSAMGGGGAENSTLTDCTIATNFAYFVTGWGDNDGGGADRCVLTRCTLAANGAPFGGGASLSTLHDCVLSGNTADTGAGAFGCFLGGCALYANDAATGGGADASSLINCTVTGNTAANAGGGANNCKLGNCILYYNLAPSGSNYSEATLNCCCTLPLPETGSNNIAAEPELAGLSHVSAASPCLSAGSPVLAAAAGAPDIDGEPWASPPSIGCDEYRPGAVTGLLNVSIQADYTNVATRFLVNLKGDVAGRPSACQWDFGDGATLSNRPYASYCWTQAGDYAVTLTAYNETNPGGISATVTVQVVEQPVHYVAFDSTNPLPPYFSWATAATSIQDAVDAAYAGGLVLVSNGVYNSGGRVVYSPWTYDTTTLHTLTNRLVVTGPIRVESVNGPAATIIQGSPTNNYGAVRCVYLGEGTALAGFTLTQGTASSDIPYGSGDPYERAGGGVWAESLGAAVSNCVLTGNWADSSGGGAFCGSLFNCIVDSNAAAGDGGGVYGVAACNCQISGNLAAGSGGGAAASALTNCTITGNLASSGGGADGGFLDSCIAYYNHATQDDNCSGLYSDAQMSYCCTTPQPPGRENITNAPAFVDFPGGDLRLQSNSPCINSGNNASAINLTDLDGNPRIAGGTVDIGAYEFQAPSSVISYAWLQQYGLPTDGSRDFADSDGDDASNWYEWRCGTDPTDPLSVLRLLLPTCNAPTNTLRWQSVTNRMYFIQRSTNFTTVPAFVTLATNIPGQLGITVYTDTNAPGLGPAFYRVGAGW